jgi:hypothetical protein
MAASAPTTTERANRILISFPVQVRRFVPRFHVLSDAKRIGI